MVSVQAMLVDFARLVQPELTVLIDTKIALQLRHAHISPGKQRGVLVSSRGNVQRLFVHHRRSIHGGLGEILQSVHIQALGTEPITQINQGAEAVQVVLRADLLLLLARKLLVSNKLGAYHTTTPIKSRALSGCRGLLIGTVCNFQQLHAVILRLVLRQCLFRLCKHPPLCLLAGINTITGIHLRISRQSSVLCIIAIYHLTSVCTRPNQLRAFAVFGLIFFVLD